MAEALIIVFATALDWSIAFVAWLAIRRFVGSRMPARLDAVMPWLIVQLFLLGGVLVTGALARAPVGAVLLTGIPVALISTFFAVPIALYRARGGNRPDFRVCLDHTLAAAAVWAAAVAASLVI
jgi:hypothetical protein